MAKVREVKRMMALKRIAILMIVSIIGTMTGAMDCFEIVNRDCTFD